MAVVGARDVCAIMMENLTINQCVSTYLMASYLYYHLHESVISDHEYDSLCKRLYKEYDKITHPHAYLFDKDDLKAGTGFAITEYPTITKVAAKLWLKDKTPLVDLVK